MSEYNDIQINLENMTIKIEGEHEIFGGADLQLKAAKTIIEMMDFKFAHETDYGYSQKAHIQLINSIGKSIKNEGVYPDEMPNIQVVQSFLNWFIEDEKLHENKVYAELLKDEEENMGEYDFHEEP
ncbi:hypothetical protein [Paenibacillus sp. FSL R10-2788]|jgi:hypothetical protein|uniref:hypothetical protein n=1 Tax=Paenibacillus sp. FSL R10-2788 TaxID=2954694 RepID=UPI0030F92489